MFYIVTKFIVSCLVPYLIAYLMARLGVMNLKSPNRITVTASNAKGEIGFVSNTNVQQKLTKVKATVANIPVGTESMQKLPGEYAYLHTRTHR